jgi:hypothetical protein
MKFRILIPICLFFLAVACFGQTVTGNLDGRVTDPAGASVPGATVTARNANTGAERSTTTNEEGYFVFPYLPIGSYEVTVTKQGFANVVAKDNPVTLNKTTTLNLALKVSAVQESITISEAAPLIDVTSGQIRRGLADDMISELPVAGRDFKSIAAVLPGFQTNPTAGQNNPTLSSGSSVSFNGTGTRGTSFMTDGIANDDYSENQNRQNVNVETVKEMQVVTNSFSAEFGRGLGAVVLVQTKSGTNSTHGEAYGFNTNTALDARSYFANASGSHVDAKTGKTVPNVLKAPGKTWRLGGTLGGPVIKDKLFYFGSFERFWAPGSTLVTTYLIPQQYLTPAVNPLLPNAAADAAWIKEVASRFPTNLTPNAPAISPYAWQGPEPRSRHDHDYSGRGDYNLSERDMIYGRYQWSTFYSGLQSEPVKGENMVQDHKFQNVGLTWTHVFSPRMTGEFRTGFGRRNMYVGFLDPNDRPPIIRWSVSGFSNIMGNASAYPILRIQNDFQYVYNFSWMLGNRQTLKMGTDIRRTQLNDNTENYNRGLWQFSSANGLNAFQNFQQGIVQSFTQGFGPAYIGERITEANFYVQDDVRVAPNFMLNLGARFERVGAPTEVNNLIPPDYKTNSYIDPRFGFAWSPKAEGLLGKLLGNQGMTSVRGGFGMFHGRVFESIYSQIGASSRFNPPNAAVLGFSNPNQEVANPTGGFVFSPGPPRSQVSLTYSDPNLHMPYTEMWNFTIERQLPWKSAFQATYAGNRGIGLLFYNWGNRAQFPVVSTQPSSYGSAAQGIFPGVLFNQIDPDLFDSNPAPGYISLTQSRLNARRPDGRYSSFLIVSNAAWSYYNALQLVYNQKGFKGLNMQASYTWSKNIDTGSEATNVGGGDINAAVSETQGMASLRGNSRLAQPQRFVISFVYDVPLFRDQRGPDSFGFLAPVIGRVLGGWQLSGNTTFASGNPFTVFLGYDLNGDGIGGDRPDLIDPSVLGRSISNARVDPKTGLQYGQEAVPISAFGPTAAQAAARNWPWYPGTGYVGSLGRNTFWMAGQNNWDLAFSKSVRLFGERHHLQFRAEMYNFTNRVMFGMPAYLSVVDTGVPGYRLQPNFGKITSQANSPRNMMMMLKYMF